MPDPSEKLYDAISERGLYSKSYDDFKSQFSSPEKVGSLYGSLKDRGLVSISADSFQNKYFSGLSGEKSSSESNQTGERQTSNTIALESNETPQNANTGVTGDSSQNSDTITVLGREVDRSRMP